MGVESLPRTIEWVFDKTNGCVAVDIIDQSRLPLRGDVLRIETSGGMITAIKTLALRGAPALGVAGAMAMALWSENESDDADIATYCASFEKVAAEVSTARPTAVNLSYGVGVVKDKAIRAIDEGATLEQVKEAVVAAAKKTAIDDEAANRAIGANGAALLEQGSKVLTHCNAGSLATSYYGTALGVIYSAFDEGKIERVFVDETRPVNQGGRLTMWELMMAGIPCTLEADHASSTLMSHGLVDAIVVGADRICSNGDTANKIGTYALAISASYHNVPFYVAAPLSTIDMSLIEGSQIPIEFRDPRELTGITASGTILPDQRGMVDSLDRLTREGDFAFDVKGGHELIFGRKGGAYQFDGWFQQTPDGIDVFNPAFDVTPASLITGIITEKGVALRREDGSFNLADFFE